jgi:hypothetical protein
MILLFPSSWPHAQNSRQSRGQSRLADAWFTGQQYNLTLAGLSFRPPPQQQFKFFFAPDKLGQAACMHGIKAAFY